MITNVSFSLMPKVKDLARIHLLHRKAARQDKKPMSMEGVFASNTKSALYIDGCQNVD